MNLFAKKETAPIPSVRADGEQSHAQVCAPSIPELEAENNSILEKMRIQQQAFDPNHLHTLTLTQILDMPIPPQRAIIEGLLYPGTYILAGSPKIGKSFLSAQFCYHVAHGIPLWGMPVQRGTALYLALEDDVGRIQRRFTAMYGVDGSETLCVATQSKLLGDGLEEQLRSFIKHHPNTSLIVIDTLQKIRGTDQLNYANDYAVVAKCKTISDELGLCILLVHHTRKQGAEDQFDTISGTNGILGCADAGIVMYKEKRVSENAVLVVTGRDQQESAITLKRNSKTQVWENCTELAPVDRTPPHEILPIVADFVDSHGGQWSGRASELLAALSEADVPVNLFTRQLNVGASWLYRHRNLRYENARTNQGSKLTFTPISQKD